MIIEILSSAIRSPNGSINLKNLQNSYPRRKRTGYYGILPLRVQIFLNARNPRSKLRGIQRRINK